MFCDRPRATKKLLRYINRRALAEKRLTHTVPSVKFYDGRSKCDTKDAAIRNLQYDFNVVVHVQFADQTPFAPVSASVV
jgi:hypothetical protein